MNEKQKKFETLSFRPIEELYTSDNLKGFNEARDLGRPGEYPFTRGIYPTMYRGRLWTMRLFSGFGTAEETNKRYHYLLEHGQTGLSVAFDFPTLMGYDSDSERSQGEVGMCGVAIDTLDDMESLFKGIPLDHVTTSMTINGPASVLLAFYFAVAQKQNVPLTKVGGTVQNDLLKEFIAQNSYAFPPDPSMRVVVDMIEYCADHAPRFHPVSISGYHIREAGSTALQELAFTLADGIAYVQACVDRGLDVDKIARRLSFFFNSHNDFFEEIAKFRAARRIWAKVMRERFHAKDERSWQLRFHTQTAGVSLTAQQPYNNVVRTTLQGLAAVLGGTQSLHTNALDETLALPTEKSARIALRTQQIIAHESGVTNTVDPLAGSYFIEKLTNEMEQEAMELITEIDAMGGMLQAVKNGFPQRQIADASFKLQQQIEKKERIIVGLNAFESKDDDNLEILKIDDTARLKQMQRLKKIKAGRDQMRVDKTLKRLKEVASSKQNLMEPLIECARAYCTLEEMITVMKSVFGEYHDPGIF
ncbi:MAG: methylmalonyl-CoA mutase [Deltaproteobacteria bacterium RIFCSPLOWO2_02_FULL_44_10]|nr:MAG: methylmalonyl-CoA mutase [Deltaproteobacteria bacterium RIFCSPHIGHO2_02_FULL_44_16]OGQ46388.1 MAG: methylmalonyl-CoA mutase [Deltaproteobacteria bacterium RIFCSPLOWO2_02_FULL_44_10]